jgi:hypothetical protein
MSIITKAALLDLAKSQNPAERQRARELFDAWVKAAPQLDVRDRLNATERMMLMQLFAPPKNPQRPRR